MGFTSLNLSRDDNQRRDDQDLDYNEEDIPDWRDVRAKLVMQYREGEHLPRRPEKNSNSSSNGNKGWAYESGDVIEAGSLIVSAPSQDFSCGGLRQQYFYKCVVLVVEHGPDFTRGLLLNRPTDRTLKDDKGNDWKVWFGGDVQGIESEDETYFCLHRLNGKRDSKGDDRDAVSSLAKDLSIPILKDIAMTPWEIAQLMVEAGEATIDDFWLVAGYAGWHPGQLQEELERGNWFMVATDADSIWDMIRQQEKSSIPTGTDMWIQVMRRIGKDALTSYTAKTKINVRFEDAMLQQWVRQKLTSSTTGMSISLSKQSNEKKQPQRQRRPFYNPTPGTLVRASSPILLDEQVFHQSLMLILQNDDEMTIGVVLNRPSSKAMILGDTELPIRYGGRFGVEGRGRPTMWLHCNHDKLQDACVGQPVSMVDEADEASGVFWKCTKEDAETAVEMGLADADDFLVVKGLSVWYKHSVVSAAGKAPAVELEASFTEVDKGSIPVVWKLLKAQELLNKNNAAENLEAANAAWMLSGDASWLLSGSKPHSSPDMSTHDQQKVQSLAYSALDRWIRTFLLRPSS